LSSRHKSRRRHRKVERWLARGRHPAAAATPPLADLVTIVAVTVIVPALGRGCLHANAATNTISETTRCRAPASLDNVVDLDVRAGIVALSGRGWLHAKAQGYRLPPPTGRPPNRHAAAPEPPRRPARGLMEPGSPQASPDTPWATIWWRDTNNGGNRVFATFWATEEIARAQMPPGDPTAIVVNVAKKAKKSWATSDKVLRSVRPGPRPSSTRGGQPDR
jgi:hypothetical protein